MQRTARLFRVFVSSTFTDMKAERNALQQHVFPRVREYCRSRGFQFQAIDLRWGVSEEAGLDQQAMNICLDELRRCQTVSPRPNFIVLLGNRYGWQPLPPQVDAEEFDALLAFLPGEHITRLKFDEFQPNLHPGKGNGWYRRDDNATPPQYVLLPRGGEFTNNVRWGAEEQALLKGLRVAARSLFSDAADPRLRKYFQSATHQEVEAGALSVDDAKNHIFAYVRQIEHLPSDASARDFVDLDEEGCIEQAAWDRQETLKTHLRSRLPPKHIYESTKSWPFHAAEEDHSELCSRVENHLKAFIDEEIEQLENLSAVQREVSNHRAFAIERARHFIGREDLLDDIASYLSGTAPHPLVVHGISGSGKTSLMSKAWLACNPSPDAAESNSSPCCICRYVAATPHSSHIRPLLESIGAQIDGEMGGAISPVPDDMNELSSWFQERLAQATAQRPFFLFVDALDQLSDTNRIHELAWLPETLPDYVRIVVSILERPGHPAGRCLENARRIYTRSTFLPVLPLASDEGATLLSNWLADANRTLTDLQRECILGAFREQGLPLWLELAFEEARHWKSFQTPHAPPADCAELIEAMFDRLSQPQAHGALIVSRTLGYLAAARAGLSEQELSDILAFDDEYWDAFLSQARHEVPGHTRQLPAVIWSRLLHDLGAYLAEKSVDQFMLLSFYHRLVRETAEAKHLRDQQRLQRHQGLAAYFGSQPTWFDDESSASRKPNRRKLSELPEQQRSGKMWEDLIGDARQCGLLSDLDFMQAKCQAGLGYELLDNYERTQAELPETRRRQEIDQAVRERCRQYAARLSEFADQCRQGLNPAMPAPPRSDEDNDTAPTTSSRAERLQRFHSFFATHRHVLADHSEWTTAIAANLAACGVVAEQGKQLQAKTHETWIQRDPCPPDRGPQQACQATLVGHTETVASVAMDADGTRAISADFLWGVVGEGRSLLHIWDLASGQCLRVLEGHRGSIPCVALSTDGRRALSGGDDGTLRLWDVDQAQCLMVLRSPQTVATSSGGPRVRSVAMSADAKLGLSGSSDGCLRLWDLESGQYVNEWRRNSAVINAVDLSPCGRRGLSGSSNTVVRLWDLEKGQILFELPGHTDSVDAVAISAEGTRAISGGADKTLRVWDLNTGQCEHVLQGRNGSVFCVAISADGRRAVAGGNDNNLRLWDLERGECLQVLDGHSDPVSAVALRMDGRQAISGSWDETLRLWNLDGGERSDPSKKHTEGVTAVALNRDGSRAITASRDTTLRLWDVATGDCNQLLEGHTTMLESVVWSPCGQRVISGGWRGELRQWDPASGQCLHVMSGHSGGVHLIALSGDGQLALAAGSKDSSLRLWDLETGACRHLLEGHEDKVTAADLSVDGRRALSGSNDKTLRLWDVVSGKCVRVFRGHNGGIDAAVLSADGRRALSGSWDKTVRLWDVETGQCIQSFRGHRPQRARFRVITDLRFSADERLALSASEDRTLRLWDLGNGQCRQVLQGHLRAVVLARIRPDGRVALSASEDETLRLWDLETGKCLATYYTGSPPQCLEVDWLTERIVCGTADGQVHFLWLRNCDLQFVPTERDKAQQSVSGSGSNRLNPRFSGESIYPQFPLTDNFDLSFDGREENRALFDNIQQLMRDGDFDTAQTLSATLAGMYRAQEDQMALQATLGNQAEIGRQQNVVEDTSPMECYLEQQSICRTLGLWDVLLLSLCREHFYLSTIGFDKVAATTLEKIERQAREIGDRELLAPTLFDQAILLAKAGEAKQTCQSKVDEALEVARQNGDIPLADAIQRRAEHEF